MIPGVPVVIMLAAVCAVAAILSWWLTGMFRAFATRRGLLDVPNARSSHSVPTPRGGGVAIVLVTLAGVAVLWAGDILDARDALAILGGGALIAAVGSVDDHRPLSAWTRLFFHFAAATWLVVWLGWARGARLPLTDPFIHFGLVGDVLVLLYVVWTVNLTNFMDGIDGLAGLEVVTVSAGTAVLWVVAGGGAPHVGVPLLLAGAAVGFLLWNWPPAQIFMGDAGSGFVGFMLAAIALRAGQEHLAVFWGSAILFGAFVVDATITFVRRLVRGERVYEAHRTHAYQRAAVRAGSHRLVTFVVGAVNTLWLFPIALLVVAQRLHPLVAFVVAYMPLVAAAIWLRAGAAAAPAADRTGNVVA